jgi:hypothetical protein
MISDLETLNCEDPDTASLRFMVSNYAATGEGHTMSILITTLSPSRRGEHQDWQRTPYIGVGEDGVPRYVPGVLAVTPREILTRQFADKFGDYFAIGIEFLDWDEMKSDYSEYLPTLLVQQVDRNDAVLDFHTQLHYNYS